MKAWGALRALWGALALISNPLAAFAQCPMCRASAEAGANGNAAFSGALNLGILVLLIPPVLIFCAIFFLAYRYRKALGDGPADTLSPNPRS